MGDHGGWAAPRYRPPRRSPSSGPGTRPPRPRPWAACPRCSPRCTPAAPSSSSASAASSSWAPPCTSRPSSPGARARAGGIVREDTEWAAIRREVAPLCSRRRSRRSAWGAWPSCSWPRRSRAGSWPWPWTSSSPWPCLRAAGGRAFAPGGGTLGGCSLEIRGGAFWRGESGGRRSGRVGRPRVGGAPGIPWPRGGAPFPSMCFLPPKSAARR